MTRDQIKKKIILILEQEIEADALDDSGLYVIPASIEAAAEKIMEVWDKGFTYEIFK